MTVTTLSYIAQNNRETPN